MTLQKNQRKVLSLMLDPSEQMISDTFVERSGQMVNTGTMGTSGLSKDYTFKVKSTVTLPNIILSKHELDFGTRTFGDSYEVCTFGEPGAQDPYCPPRPWAPGDS